MDFCFSLPTPSPEPAILSPPAIPVCTVPPVVAFVIEVFDGYGGLPMGSISSFDLSTPSLVSLGGVFARVKKIVNTTVTFHGLSSPPPLQLLSTYLR